ncbi:hypothetical protein BD410DRAFT_842345 [Rickenella mellea]|uniref:Uncharacterized protein n=1 Tax=Rickenella mellea TaxID=50990 RepID=A0A4Y7PWV6_9AGAM|nr:hypothetical protein BD410DRAFT_842345 [Rickenella mellea]
MTAKGTIGNWLTVLVGVSNPLTINLINRLVLNLRRVSHIQEGNAPTFDAIGTIHEPAFANNSLLGNLGAPLRVGSDSEDDDDIDEISVEDQAEVVEKSKIEDHSEIIEVPRDPSDV